MSSEQVPTAEEYVAGVARGWYKSLVPESGLLEGSDAVIFAHGDTEVSRTVEGAAVREGLRVPDAELLTSYTWRLRRNGHAYMCISAGDGAPRPTMRCARARLEAILEREVSTGEAQDISWSNGTFWAPGRSAQVTFVVYSNGTGMVDLDSGAAQLVLDRAIVLALIADAVRLTATFGAHVWARG